MQINVITFGDDGEGIETKERSSMEKTNTKNPIPFARMPMSQATSDEEAKEKTADKLKKNQAVLVKPENETTVVEQRQTEKPLDTSSNKKSVDEELVLKTSKHENLMTESAKLSGKDRKRLTQNEKDAIYREVDDKLAIKASIEKASTPENNKKDAKKAASRQSGDISIVDQGQVAKRPVEVLGVERSNTAQKLTHTEDVYGKSITTKDDIDLAQLSTIEEQDTGYTSEGYTSESALSDRKSLPRSRLSSVSSQDSAFSEENLEFAPRRARSPSILSLESNDSGVDMQDDEKKNNGIYAKYEGKMVELEYLSANVKPKELFQMKDDGKFYSLTTEQEVKSIDSASNIVKSSKHQSRSGSIFSTDSGNYSDSNSDSEDDKKPIEDLPLTKVDTTVVQEVLKTSEEDLPLSQQSQESGFFSSKFRNIKSRLGDKIGGGPGTGPRH